MKSNAANLKVLIKLTETFGLIPGYNFEINKFQQRKIYNYVLLTLLGVFYVYTIYMKVILRIENGSKIAHLEDLTEICEFSINTFTVVAAVTWKFKDFCEFFETYDKFDKILLDGFKTQIPFIKYFNVHFGIVYLITLTEIVSSFFWYNENKGKAYGFSYFGVFYFDHCVCLLTIAEYFFLIAIYNRFKVINNILNKLDSDDTESTFISIKPADDEFYLEVNRVFRLHALACKLVDYFNDLFGVHILCVIFIHVVDILISFHMMILQSEFLNLALSVSWVLLGISQIVMVATVCEKVGRENKETIAVSFSLLYKYSSNQITKRKLKILSQQANNRRPQFSAAGFFNVDFSMLFMFVNLITTYMIVIIQFSTS